jgi:hypothetical protein
MELSSISRISTIYASTNIRLPVFGRGRSRHDKTSTFEVGQQTQQLSQAGVVRDVAIQRMSTWAVTVSSTEPTTTRVTATVPRAQLWKVNATTGCNARLERRDHGRQLAVGWRSRLLRVRRFRRRHGVRADAQKLATSLASSRRTPTS